MVFELSDTLINEAVVNDTDKRRSLNNLFLGYEEGNLLLSASPELLDFLKERLDDSLSQRIINHLQHKVWGRYRVLWQIKVVLDNPDISNHEVSIDFFKQTSAIQPPIVLCENLDDTRFYFALCQEFFGELYINTENGQGGGGSSVADNLEHIVSNKDRFCLCIVDSDVKYKGAPDGGTFAAIQNKKLEPNPTFFVYKLHVHEIENLIPIEIIIPYVKEKSVQNFAQRLKTIDYNGDILFYYDIKDGISLKSIRANQDYYKFAEMIYQRLSKPSSHISFASYLSSIKNSNCVFDPLCPGVLTAFLHRNNHNKPRFIYCDYLRTEWALLKDYIVTFLCCRHYEPIN